MDAWDTKREAVIALMHVRTYREGKVLISDTPSVLASDWNQNDPSMTTVNLVEWSAFVCWGRAWWVVVAEEGQSEGEFPESYAADPNSAFRGTWGRSFADTGGIVSFGVVFTRGQTTNPEAVK